MDLPPTYLADLRRADDVYKLISVCYDLLLEYKKDTDVVFVTRAGHLSQDATYKDSAEAFENLRQNLLIALDQIDMGLEEDGKGFEHLQNALLRELTGFSCPVSMDIDTCISLCMFYTLEALDSYVYKNLDSVYMKYETFGPLNGDYSQKKSVVYLQERSSYLSMAYTGENGFRKPLRDTRIGSVFRAVLLMQCQEFRIAVPEIVPVFPPEGCRNELLEKISIVSIPYIGFETFKFHEANNVESCKNAKTLKGPFYVEYDNNDEIDSRRAVALLDLAIKKGANIIVFPEFIMSGNMLNEIKKHLQQLAFADKKRLLLVFAGTNYQRAGEYGGDNILHILNASGYEVGCYFKHSSFLLRSEEWIHGADILTNGEKESSDNSASPSTRKFIEACEILSNPGKECTFVDVELMGRIQPAICRDVIDGTYTESLAKLFQPSFLIVPAWSTSVTSFDSRFSILADTIHTVSLLCNCCNAVEGEGKKVIGKLKYPSKEGTSMQAQSLNINRRPLCLDKCKAIGGCIIQIDIEFSRGKPTAKYRRVTLPCTA